jgi:hypothetical protein
MNRLSIVLAGLLVSGGAGATCFTPFGDLRAVQTAPNAASGAATLYLAGGGVTTEHQGAVQGTVTAFDVTGLPKRIAYTFTGPSALLKLTGTPVLSSFAPLDACIYSLRIDTKLNAGSKIGTKAASGAVVLRGVTDACTGAETYYAVSGSVCY